MDGTNYPTATELVHRLRRALLDADNRKVSFIIGSGTSIGAVPSVSQVVGYFRAALGSDAEDLNDFDSLLLATPDHKKYQTAADFLINRAGITKVNRAIRIAVLKARTPPISADTYMTKLSDEAWMEGLNKDHKNWVIPKGITALGQVLAMIPNDARGPILTTNFDPLIEVSLRAAGIQPWPISADSDGSVSIPPIHELGIVPVVHVHGLWSEGDTLHSPLQLTHPRPQLAASIRQLIAGTTCCVIGYSGWDDVLTRSIEQMLIAGRDYDVDILWASHGSIPSMGELENKSLPGHLHPYVNVDSNKVIPEIKEAIAKRLKNELSSITPLPPVTETRTTLKTLSLIDDRFIAAEQMRHLDANIAISYFDGRQPNWADVLKIGLPELSSVSSLKYLMSDTQNVRHVRIEAPVGEGKSTSMMQLAKWVSSQTADRAYYASSIALDAAEVLGLPVTSGRTFVFVDDADLRVNQVHKVVQELGYSGRSDLRLVLAARDSDWSRACHSAHLRFDDKTMQKQVIGGMTFSDATQIVRTWNHYGPEALGRLQERDTEVDRAEALRAESVDAGGSALLGALLYARYGEGFRDHILSLMRKLSRVEVSEGYSLLRVYATICLFSVGDNVKPLTLKQLSVITNLSQRELDALVVSRLGREAATQKHGQHISARHKRIAQTVLSLLEEFRLSTEVVMRDAVIPVVRQAINSPWDSDVLNVAYFSQRAEDKPLATAAGKAAVDADPSQLRLWSAYAGVLRKFELLPEARATCQKAWKDFGHLSDSRIAYRRFLLEWSRTEGRLGRIRDSLALNAAVLLDWPDVDDLTADPAARALSGMAYCFAHLPVAEEEKGVLWQGVLAEEASTMTSAPEIRNQAQMYLSQARTRGYSGVDSTGIRKELISGAIRNAVYSSSLAVANKSRPFVSDCRTLWSLTYLL